MNVTALGRRVMFSTALNYIGKLSIIGTGLLTTPFILQHLGPTLYGLWVLVGSVAAYGGLLDLGITTAVVKYVAEFRARRESEEVQHLLATAMWVYSGFGLLAALAGALFAPVFPVVFQVPPEDRSTASWLVFVAATVVGISLPCTIPPAILRGLQRFDLLNIVAVGGTLLTAGLAVGVLLLGGGVVAITATGFIAAPLVLLLSLWLVHQAAPDLRWGWRDARRGLLRSVLSYSAPIAVVNASQRLQTKTDEIVIGALLPVSMVTPYALASRLSKAAPMLIDQFTKLLVPLASEFHAVEHPARLRALFVTSTRLTLALYVPVGGLLVLLSGPLLALWVGAAYAGYTYVTTLLVAAALFDCAMGLASQILQGMARHRLLAATSLAAGLTNLGLSIALVGPFGLAGVALGTLIPASFECVVLVVPFAMRLMHVGPRELVRDAVWPVLVPLAVMSGITYALQQAIDPASLVMIVLIAGLGGLVYAITYLALARGRIEYDVFLALLASTVHFARTGLRFSR